MSTKSTVYYHHENPYIHLYWDYADGKMHLSIMDGEHWTDIDVPQKMLDSITEYEKRANSVTK